MALKAEKIFDLMTEHLKSNKDAIKKVGGVLHFEIALKKGDEPVVWTVDLAKTGFNLNKIRHSKKRKRRKSRLYIQYD